MSQTSGTFVSPEPGSVVAGLADERTSREARHGRAAQAVSVFFEHKMAVAGVAYLLLILLFCFVGPHVYSTDQVNANVAIAAQPPGARHLLGTDQSGFDILGRLMVGGQTSIEVGFGAAAFGAVLGVLWGAVSGFVGGVVDSLMMRIVDAALSIPALLMVLVIATIIQPNVLSLILIVGLFAWLVPARLVRGETLVIKELPYMDAGKVAGARRWHMLFRHVIPNSAGTIIVNATFQVADAIILVSYLDFLGLGMPPPATNWGGMLSNGLNLALSGYWWMIYPPGIAIILTVMAVNYVGDGLRDIFDTRLVSR